MIKKMIQTGVALLAGSAWAASEIPLPPFIYHGEIVRWDGVAIGAKDDAQVAAKLGGVVVARCNLVNGEYPNTNYRLHIPMSETRRAGKAQTGDVVTFEVYYDGAVHSVMDAALLPAVGDPAGFGHCNMVIGTDSNTNGLPDEYDALLLPYYLLNGQAAADITAQDDFDGDGYSNQQEFIAGTVPVMAADFPSIRSLHTLPAGWFAFKFLTAPGRTYRIQGADSAAQFEWAQEIFSLQTNQVPVKTFFTSEDDGVTTLYLCPTNQAHFYQLRID